MAIAAVITSLAVFASLIPLSPPAIAAKQEITKLASRAIERQQ
jgi:hypothetical protein